MSKAFCLSVMVLAGVMHLSAQDAPAVRSGVTELGLNVGASYGADQFRVMGGANVSYSVNQFLLPYAEFSYFPELLRRRVEPDAVVEGSARLIDFHGGLHLRKRIAESKFVPYAVVGLGVIHSDVNITTRAGEAVATETGSAADLTVNFGAGLRYYQNERFGLRTEYKLYRPLTGRFDNVFSKVEVGLFFQFGR